MDAFFVLAYTAIRSRAHGDVAFSALPNAPVLPVVERRHRLRPVVPSLRRARSVATVHRQAHVADCVAG